MNVRQLIPADIGKIDDILASNGMAREGMLPTVYFVAEVDGEVIGGGGMHVIRSAEYPVGWLCSVAVSKAHKRSGVGSAIVRANLDLAAGRGYNSMWLETYFWNSRFYESIGFEGIRPDLVPEQIRAWRTKKHCRFMVNTGCASSSQSSKAA